MVASSGEQNSSERVVSHRPLLVYEVTSRGGCHRWAVWDGGVGSVKTDLGATGE